MDEDRELLQAALEWHRCDDPDDLPPPDPNNPRFSIPVLVKRKPKSEQYMICVLDMQDGEPVGFYDNHLVFDATGWRLIQEPK